MWIQAFGLPQSFTSDNGVEFNNENFRSKCERFNSSVKTTAAESPGVMVCVRGTMRYSLVCIEDGSRYKKLVQYGVELGYLC